MKFRAFMIMFLALVAGTAVANDNASVLPTDLLIEEHQIVVTMLEVLDSLSARAAATGRLDADAATKSTTFLREFVDLCHHNKEEKHLFPLLLMRAEKPDSQIVTDLLAQHDQGRALVGAMRASTPEAAHGDSSALVQFVKAASSYTALLRQHIRDEDSVLFARVQMRLTAADQQALTAAFEQVEEQEIGAGVHERFHAMVEQLAEEYLSTKNDSPGGDEHRH